MMKIGKVRNISIKFPELYPATLIERENRFRVKIRYGENTASAHLANPGRIKELLIPGVQVWISKAQNPKRKTPFSLELVSVNGTLVSLNSQLPNKLIDQALMQHEIPNMPGYLTYQREVPLGHSRMDFCVYHNSTTTWIEVKSVTLVNNNTAAFPDAPTKRGQRHLSELMAAVNNGVMSLVIFVVQRQDAKFFKPNDATDPEFGRSLRQATQIGVRILAVNCKVTTCDITLNHYLPVLL